MTVVRIDHPTHATPVFPNVPLPRSGLAGTHVVIGSSWERHCGCKIHIGFRLDNQEKAMISSPCDTHGDRFEEVTVGMLTPEGRDRETGEVFDDLVGQLDD